MWTCISGYNFNKSSLENIITKGGLKFGVWYTTKTCFHCVLSVDSQSYKMETSFCYLLKDPKCTTKGYFHCVIDSYT